jgi:hypothetical protein
MFVSLALIRATDANDMGCESLLSIILPVMVPLSGSVSVARQSMLNDPVSRIAIVISILMFMFIGFTFFVVEIFILIFLS